MHSKAFVCCLFLAFFSNNCMSYLAHVGYGQLVLLWGQRDIEEVI